MDKNDKVEYQWKDTVSLVKERHTTLECNGSDGLHESRIDRVNDVKEGCGRSRNYPQAIQAGRIRSRDSG